MKIKQLIYFVEAARHEHIGKAAKLLSISPSAVSHSIKSLENELGHKLFQKQGKFIQLTAEGHKLLLKSEDLIDQFQKLSAELKVADSDSSYFRIGSSHTLASQFVTPVWSQLNSKYSATKIDLLTLRSADVLSQVISRELDFGILFNPQDHPDLSYYRIHEGQIYPTVRKNHPINALKGLKRLRELNQYPAILPKAFQGIDICVQSPMFEKFNITPNAKTLTDSYDISLGLIKHSDYWGFTPEISIGKDFQAISEIRGWNASYNISLIYRKRRFEPNFFSDLREGLSRFIENKLN